MSKLYTFDIKKLYTDFEFGSGPMGAVHPYRRKQNDERWVGKYLLTKNFEEFQVINRGLNLNCNHDHPSILCPKTVYISECKPRGYRVLVKYPRMRGSLKTIIEEQREKFVKAKKSKEYYFSKQQVIQYLYSILVGLEYLEKKGIAHTNLKPTNVLYGEDGRLKLNDIGLAREFIENDTGSFLIHKRGPEFYQAPEIFMDNRPQRKCELLKVDMWSLGMIMAEVCLLTPENMFPFSPLEQRRQRIKEYIEQITKIYGEDVAELVEDLLRLDPNERKTAAQMAMIMRDKFPGIKELGKSIEEDLGGTQRRVNPIQIVSEDLQNNFGQKFKFEYKKGFAVRARECGDIEDTTVQELLDGIKEKLKEQKVERLEQLSLNLRGCQKITNEGFIKSVSRISSDLQNLKNLSLSIGPKGLEEKCQVTDEGLKHLSTNISQHLTELQSLSLDFNGCENITESGIKQLVTDISEKMNKLQGLSLEFGQDPLNKAATQITDETVDYMSSTICSQLRGLKQLSLAFRGYVDITDTGLKSVEAHIRKLTGLTELSLKFYRCDNVTGEGIKKLANGINDNLRNIHQLTFVFSWCEKISVEDKKQVKDILRMIPKLNL